MFKRSPEALAIVAAILLIFVGLTWVVPSGEYARADYTADEAYLIMPLSESEREQLENGEGEGRVVELLLSGQSIALQLNRKSDGELSLASRNDVRVIQEGDQLHIPAFAFGELIPLSDQGNFELAVESVNVAFRKGKKLVIPDSYKTVSSHPQGIRELLLAPIRGFADSHAALIIAFVLLVGGSFTVLTATGSIDAALQGLLRKALHRPGYKRMLIPLLMTIFSLAGCTFGMAEEVLVFVLITLPLARSLGYDPIIGAAIPFVGAGAGFAGAALNPFTVGIAQGIAQLPPGSGSGYRWIVWAGYTIVAIIFVMAYAAKLDKHPERKFRSGVESTEADVKEVAFNWSRKLILVLFFTALILLMIGAQYWGWYIEEIAALFVALGLVAAILSSLGVRETVQAFTNGAKDMLPAALIIGMSRSILVVAEEGRIIDTVLHGLASTVGDLHPAISVQLMFFVQGAINFFIPSGSGQAAITMPIMTPLADLIGIGRQTAVLAFQFGDGLFNLVIPTSGVTMGVLSIAGIPFSIWIKWVWKLVLALILLSMIFLALPLTVFEWA